MQKLLVIISAVALTLTLTLSSWLDAAPRAQAGVRCNPKCGACTYRIDGSWRYYVERTMGDRAFDGTYDIVQTGNIISNSNESSNSMYGNIQNNKVDLTFVVNGEELEWWVMHCEGHVFGTERDMMAAVCQDVQGTYYSFTARKQ